MRMLSPWPTSMQLTINAPDMLPLLSVAESDPVVSFGEVAVAVKETDSLVASVSVTLADWLLASVFEVEFGNVVVVSPHPKQKDEIIIIVVISEKRILVRLILPTSLVYGSPTIYCIYISLFSYLSKPYIRD